MVRAGARRESASGAARAGASPSGAGAGHRDGAGGGVSPLRVPARHLAGARRIHPQRRARRPARGRGSARSESTSSSFASRTKPRRWRPWRASPRRTPPPPGSASSGSSNPSAAASPRRWSRPTSPPAPTAWPSSSTPQTAAIRYPFINCTNCGPRFTIVRGVPYDRPLTTMASFRDVQPSAGRSTRIRATAASTPSRTPVPTAGRGCGSSTAAATRSGSRAYRDPIEAAAAQIAHAAGSSRSRAWAAFTSPAAPTTRRPSPRCARASIARTSRSR